MAVILILLLVSHTAQLQKNCALSSSGDVSVHFKDGDFILAGILQVNYWNIYDTWDYQSAPEDRECTTINKKYLRHYLTFLFAIEEINKDPNILPNITLGYDIYDTCTFNELAAQATMRALSGGVKHYWNYRCGNKGKTIAFIGHLLSAPSQSISQMLSPYGHPQISHGEKVINKINNPLLYHTAHGTNVINKAIVKVLKHFGWTLIGIFTDNEDDFIKASEDLKEESIKSGICVEYVYKIPSSFHTFNVNYIKKTKSNIIIFNVSWATCNLILTIASISSKLIILSKDQLSDVCITSYGFNIVFNEALLFSPQKGNINGLREMLQNTNPTVYPDSKILQNVWLKNFKCLPSSDTIKCTENHTLASFSNLEYDVDNLRTTYSVYLAVYAVAHALNNMYMANKAGKKHGSFIQRIHPKQLNRFIRNINFTIPTGENIVFDESGVSNTHLELLHVSRANNTYTKKLIGEYSPNARENDSFFIRKDCITLEKNIKEAHFSTCVDSCLPGERKSVNKRLHCCYSCTPCSTGEFSYGIDMDKCEQCPEDEWPNTRKSACLKRSLDFLSFHDLLGSLLISFIVILYVCSFIILVIFIKYRETPIVQANNRNLSYIILISLMLSFLCSLLFIGNPAKLTCLLQNIIFNLVFAVAVSSILAKTITVIIAFNVTKPSFRFRKLMSKISYGFVVFCFIGELGICVYWITLYPPFPARDSVSKPRILILYCNVGSHVIFYLALGYNSFLALLCFLVAYFAKKLPDRFNEALHITFSMLVFCSVWISFIPAYVSTKGKYMTAVQVFAILASNTGLLGFIFIPKCFIIIFRPGINVKKSQYIRS